MLPLAAGSLLEAGCQLTRLAPGTLAGSTSG
jgi:hypothetical protein